MSNGYRFIIVATGGIALLVALFVGAYFGSLYSPDQKQYHAEASESAERNYYKGPSESLPDIAGIPSPIERAISNPQPYTGADHEKRDLAAQEASALWAFWIAVISGFTLIISAFSLWALHKTIRQGQEANAITREQFEASFKPWLSVKAVGPYTDPAQDLLKQFDGPPNQSRWVTIEASVTLTNVADVPAIIEWVNLFCINETSISIGNGGHVEKWIELAKGDSTILSQLDESFAEVSGRTPFGYFHLNAANRDEFLSYYPAICGRILYSDPVGNQRLLGFAFRPQFLWGEKLHRWGSKKYNFDHKIEGKEAIALIKSGWSPGNPARKT